MNKKLYLIVNLLALLFVSLQVFATESYQGLRLLPQPTTCVTSNFSKEGNDYWSVVSLRLTNQCGAEVDFQNATIAFNNADYLNVPAWGIFTPLAYPDNNLQMTSQPLCTGYRASISLHFSGISKLPNGQSITLIYGTSKASYDPNPETTNVYLTNQPNTAEIGLVNNTAQPTGAASTASVNIVSNGTTVTTAALPWSGQTQVTGLAAGSYQIQPVNVTDTLGNTYQGTATPNTLALTAGQKANTTITYTQVAAGRIRIAVSALPSALSGYTNNPQVVLTRSGTGSTVTSSPAWNSTTTVRHLANNALYTFSTPVINYRNARCTGAFSPASATSSAQNPPTTNLAYTCVVTQLVNVGINVSGLTSATPSVNVTLTPSDGSAPIVRAVTLTNGQGSATVSANDGTVFNVSATSVNGYTASFNPQPLTARANAVETITYRQQSTLVNVGINVSGLTSATSSVNVTLTPSDGSAPIVRAITLTNGQGSATVSANDGTVFNVSATSVNGYTASFSPQPLTARANALETITYQQQSTGNGGIKITMPAKPTVLANYPNCPVIKLTRADNGAITTVTAPWNTTTSISSVANNVTYGLSTPVISTDSRRCTATITPNSVTSNATNPPTATVAYTCT